MAVDIERQFYLVEMIFDDETLYLSTTPFDLNWNGRDWLGAGAIANISPYGDDISMSAQSVTLELSGVPLDKITDARSEKYRDRIANVYYGGFDQDLNIETPVVVYSGGMDSVIVTSGNGTATISVEVLSPLVKWEKVKSYRYTTEMQRTRFPNDLGFEFVTAIQNQQLDWGNVRDD